MTHTFRTLVAAAVAALSLSSAAQAAIVISATSGDSPLPGDQTLVYDFDGLSAAGYNVSFAGPVNVFNGADGLHPNVAAPPPGVTNNYLAIQGGGSATLTALGGISKLSVYMGSPDSFNFIRFIGLNGFDVTYGGNDLAAGVFNGDQTIGRRMTYDFGGQVVTKVVFGSSGNSFELDNIAVSAVPEPATWAMMIAGFGMMGAALRRRQSALAYVRA